MSHEMEAPFSFALSASDPIRQPLRMGQQTFPGIWREMMPAALMDLRFPEEREANCGRCPKSCYDGWRPDYRCCTYHPRISNFLLGLACQTLEGDRAVDELLQRGMLLPEGMHSSPRQWLDFVADDHADQFGKSQRVLCPLLDPTSGFCRVHVFRNSVCSTYFCTNDQGQAGQIFWSQIQTLGTQLEMRLAQWALSEIGFDVAASLKALDELTPILSQVSTDQGWTPEALKLIWGPYWGREKELLHACAAVIVKNRGQLWSIAAQQVIAEPLLFDQALHQQAPDEHQEFLEADEEQLQEVSDLNALWSDCLEAHDALWAEPSGLFTLSPNVTFVPNKAQSAEEIHQQGKAFFIEYRFNNPERSLYFRLAITEQQKKLLDGFEQVQLKLTDAGRDAQEFLKQMIHRKVLWAVSDSLPD